MVDDDRSVDDASVGKWTKVSIRVASRRLTADEVQAVLGDTPAKKAERGDQISGRSPHAGVHTFSWCTYECPLPGDAPPERHFEWLTEFVARHEQALESLKDDCEVDARMSFSSASGQGAFLLDGRMLSLLGRFDVRLHLDLYPPER